MSERDKLARLVKILGIISLAGVAFGLVAAHGPALAGTPYTNCRVTGSVTACLLAIHLLEVPLVAFDAFFGWWCLSRYSWARVRSFLFLTVFVGIANTVFFAMEFTFLVDALRRQTELWEPVAFTTMMFMMVGGVGLCIYAGLQALAELGRAEGGT